MSLFKLFFDETWRKRLNTWFKFVMCKNSRDASALVSLSISTAQSVSASPKSKMLIQVQCNKTVGKFAINFQFYLLYLDAMLECHLRKIRELLKWNGVIR